jgi:DNA gyrase subunit A
MAVDKLRIMGRATQGVKLINIKDKDAIASIAKTPKEEEEEEMILTDESTEISSISTDDTFTDENNTDNTSIDSTDSPT